MAENGFEGETSDVEDSHSVQRESEIEGETLEEEQATISECPEQLVTSKPPRKAKVKKRRRK